MSWDKNYSEALNYDDVFIIPQYSEISSRKEVDVSYRLDNNSYTLEVDVPIMPANMETIAGPELASAVLKAGGLGTLHRFQTIEESIADYLQVNSPNVFVSVGVNRDSQDRAKALFQAGARFFIIDIAHGHSKQMKDMLEWFRSELADTYIMAGNIGNPQGLIDLVTWGADAVKVGIGPGAVCLTKNVTGVTVPQFTNVRNCAIAKSRLEWELGRKLTLVADGGVQEIGDVCKAIAAGADLVMAGKLFAGCVEAPGRGVYRGSASADVQTLYRSDQEYIPTPEGKSIQVDRTNESAAYVTEHVAGGLRSSFSYVGARTMREFQQKVTFGIRHNKS